MTQLTTEQVNSRILSWVIWQLQEVAQPWSAATVEWAMQIPASPFERNPGGLPPLPPPTPPPPKPPRLTVAELQIKLVDPANAKVVSRTNV
jgi:hypothetical protein